MLARNYITPPDPRLALAVAFPPDHGLRGACVTLADLCRPDHYFPRLTSRRWAAHLCVARNLSPVETGGGHRAERRKLALDSDREQSQWFAANCGLTERDVDQLAAIYAEQRGESRLLAASGTNFHD